MASVIPSWTFLGFNDEESMAIFFLIVRCPLVRASLLPADLRTSNVDRSQMGTAALLRSQG